MDVRAFDYGDGLSHPAEENVGSSSKTSNNFKSKPRVHEVRDAKTTVLAVAETSFREMSTTATKQDAGVSTAYHTEFAGRMSGSPNSQTRWGTMHRDGGCGIDRPGSDASFNFLGGESASSAGERHHYNQYVFGSTTAAAGLQQQQARLGLPTGTRDDDRQSTGTEYGHHQNQLMPVMPPLQHQRNCTYSAGGFDMHAYVDGLPEQQRMAYYKVVGNQVPRNVLHRKSYAEQREEGDDDAEEHKQMPTELGSMAEHEQLAYHAETQMTVDGGGAPPVLLRCSSYGEIAGLATSSVSHDGARGDSMSTMMNMKKRRLTNEQVRSLETCFERESKLEAERKIELAMELGLQPRQVAVWFQNRRARFKTKQLERDFDILKLQYDAVRSEKEKLLAQVAKLKDLLDAQMTPSKANTPTTSNENQGMEDGAMRIPQPSPHQHHDAGDSMDECHDGNTQKDGGVGGDEALVSPHMLHHVEALKMLDATQRCPKGAVAIEVKPSLQVPHVSHHRQHDLNMEWQQYRQQQPPPQQQRQQQRQQQQQFFQTLSPPTNLSLCSQQIHLHPTVATTMEEGNVPISYHEPSHMYNHAHQYGFTNSAGDTDEDENGDSMTGFDSVWPS